MAYSFVPSFQGIFCILRLGWICYISLIILVFFLFFILFFFLWRQHIHLLLSDFLEFLSSFTNYDNFCLNTQECTVPYVAYINICYVHLIWEFLTNLSNLIFTLASTFLRAISCTKPLTTAIYVSIKQTRKSSKPGYSYHHLS